MARYGIQSQLMLGEETTYATIPTLNRTFEFREESLTHERTRYESQGIRAGQRVVRSYQWAGGTESTTGNVVMEVAYTNFGVWFKHMFGGVLSSQPNVGASPTVWEHAFTPGTLSDKSLSLQVGFDALTKTISGAMIESWKLEAAINEFLMLDVGLVGRAESTATALGTASYFNTLKLLKFTEATLTVGGTTQAVEAFTLEGSNALAASRYQLGSALMRRPGEPSRRGYTGNLVAEFSDFTLYNRVVSGAEAALVLTFTGPMIDGTYNHSLLITLNIRSDGETPTVSGMEEVKQTLNFVAVDAGSGGITALYRTTDSTP